jgi:hypothetical protein
MKKNLIKLGEGIYLEKIKEVRTAKKFTERDLFFDLIKQSAEKHGKQLTFEYIFHPERKWRFDIACVELKIACEYEGINATYSRHTTLLGYTADCEKYDNAAVLGWRVFRFTALSFSKKNIEKTKELIEKMFL